MKLALPLLLVTLALCCPDANAGEVCPALRSLMSSFLVGSRKEYQLKINKFDAPEEAIQAALKLKRCFDKIPREEQLATAQVVLKVVNKCKKQSE